MMGAAPGGGDGTPRRLRVLVVEDSLTIRRYLVKVLTENGLDVVAETGDGERAAQLCVELRPDVVTMDMILPGMSGLAATEQIMAYSPTPILIVSSSVNRGEVFETYEALAAGAVDVLDKLREGEQAGDWARRFAAAVRMAARIKVITHPRARLGAVTRSVQEVQAGADPGGGTPGRDAAAGRGAALIALGASTGGPAAIAEILRGLPAEFPVPLLIVLHISELFAFAFAEWLNTLSPIPARYAQDGERMPQRGRPAIVLAPAGKHLVAEGETLRLLSGPERNSCRPSIDVLFESLARQGRPGIVAGLLTGMGRDGAAGLAAARAAGCDTFAQDEATSVIFGMPAEAIRMGGAARVLPLERVAPYLRERAGLAPALAGRAAGSAR